MRTTFIGNTLFRHNGDYSGNVTIRVPGQPDIEIPFPALAGFVAGFIRSVRMSRLENEEDEDTLGVKIPD